MNDIRAVVLTCTLIIGHIASCFDWNIERGFTNEVTQFPFYGYIVSGAVDSRTREIDPTPLCGAVLISDRYILSHASCLQNYKQKQLFVQFGITRWCPPIAYVDNLHHYADLSYVEFSGLYNGLAVARLDRRIPITPIRAPLSRLPFKNAYFGLPSLGKPKPNELQRCEPLLKQLTPAGPYRSLCPSGSGVLCFEARAQGDMCYGDEGGPIIERIEGRDHLRGIAWKNSHSGCLGTTLAVDVWTELPWIRRIVPEF